jgi:RNA polymerase sigma factor (sigma-70 family)
MNSDDQLIAELSGDRREQALAEIIRRHGRMVERTGARMVRDASAAEDVSQAVFLVLLRKADALTREGSIAGWLHRTTVMVAQNALREGQRRRHRELEVGMSKRSDAAEAAEMPAGFDEALERLPAIYRMAIELRYLEGRTAHEIADVLGLKPSTVDMRITRGLQRLRALLVRTAPGLTVATLAGILSEEAAHAAIAGPIAGFQVSALLQPTAGAQPALTLSQGVLKTMFITKLKMLAVATTAALCLTGGTAAVYISAAEAHPPKKTEPKKDDTKKDGKALKRTGPFADMPSRPGPTIDKIKALGDNEWLNIGKAAADPKHGEGSVRSWSCRMPYAADLGGAFVSGQGPHGYVAKDGYYDDIFFYDENAHRWICCTPGINTATFVADIKSGKIKIGDKGYLVYDDGQPVFAFGHHAYHRLAYDSDNGVFTTSGWGNGTGGDMHIIGAAAAAWYNEGRALLQEKLQGRAITPAWPPFCYDTKTGKMNREGPAGNFYLPSKKAFWLLWDGRTMMSDIGGETHPSGPVPKVAYPQLCDFPACQDSKRDRIYIGRKNPQAAGEGDFYIYDVATNAWSNPPCKGTIETMPSTNNGIAHYDTANDRVIVMGGWCASCRGDVLVWDPSTCAWENAGPIKAPMGSTGQNLCVTGFYSSEHNAHFLQIGVDGEVGDWWVYRYKKAKAK